MREGTSKDSAARFLAMFYRAKKTPKKRWSWSDSVALRQFIHGKLSYLSPMSFEQIRVMVRSEFGIVSEQRLIRDLLWLLEHDLVTSVDLGYLRHRRS